MAETIKSTTLENQNTPDLSGVPESAVISVFSMAGTPGTSRYVSPVHWIHHGMPLLSSVFGFDFEDLL